MASWLPTTPSSPALRPTASCDARRCGAPAHMRVLGRARVCVPGVSHSALQRRALREVLALLACARTAGRAVERFYDAAIATATAGGEPGGGGARGRPGVASAHADGVGAYRTFCASLNFCLALIAARVATGAAPYLAEVGGERCCRCGGANARGRAPCGAGPARAELQPLSSGARARRRFMNGRAAAAVS